MHRDLKPSNILLDEEHLVRICDFGLSKLEALELTLTKEVGTSLYMASEMSEDEYTNKIDVFSFAMILYELVVGKKAFPDSLTRQETILRIVQGKRAVIPDLVLPFTKSLIEKCWADKADNRPSFQEILSELRHNRYQIVDGSIRMRLSSSSNRCWTANVNKPSSVHSSCGSFPLLIRLDTFEPNAIGSRPGIL
jgi:serine/threonine protein kinase